MYVTVFLEKVAFLTEKCSIYSGCFLPISPDHFMCMYCWLCPVFWVRGL